jgi:hypothetical protein
MATLATHFKTALSNIEPNEDAKNAQQAHAEVSDALKADNRLKGLGVDPFLIGSYGRQVSIRRVKDVDVFARLRKADKSLRPGEILDHVEEVLEEAFPCRVTRQHRSVMVDFPDYDLTVDVVIARPCGDHWEIPEKIEDDGNARWVEMNPIKMGELTTKPTRTTCCTTMTSTAACRSRSSSSFARFAGYGWMTSPAGTTSRSSPTTPSTT